MSEQVPPTGGAGREPTEEELRAAYEAELRRVSVEDLIANMVVSLINLAGRRAGLAPGWEDERDPEQVRLAIEAVRGLLPLVEAQLGPDARSLHDALSQLQFAYAQMAREGAAAAAGGAAPGAGAPEGAGGPAGPGAEGEPAAPGAEGEPPGGPPSPEPGAPRPDEPGPAQRSGRLWIPGQ